MRARRVLSVTCAIGGLVTLVGTSMLARGRDQRLDTLADALACAHTAIGGTNAVASVRSLALTVQSQPDTGASSEIDYLFGLPDKFKQVNRSQLPSPDGRATPIAMTSGFAGDTPFASSMAGPVPDVGAEYLRGQQHQFARLLLMWLMRQSPLVPVTLALVPTAEQGRVAIQATGPNDFNLVVLLDAKSCLPAAATWRRRPNMGDALRGRAGGQAAPPADGLHVERIDLLDHRVVDGLRFPTRMQRSLDGVSRWEQLLTNIRVNPALSDEAFRPGN